MAEAMNPAELLNRNFRLKLGATVETVADVGLVDGLQFSAKVNWGDITCEQLGKQVLGMRALGCVVTLKANLRQIVLNNLQRAMPWGSAGAWRVNPPVLGADIYTYAIAAVLHPMDLDAETVDQDVTIPKLVIVNGLDLKASAEKDAVIPLEGIGLPDRTALPLVHIAYVGALSA